MEVTDTINYNDDIFATVSARKSTARGKSRAGGRSQNKSAFIKVGI